MLTEFGGSFFGGGAAVGLAVKGAKAGVVSARVGRGAESAPVATGGRQLETVTSWKKADAEAFKFYEQVRHSASNADVQAIARNTGIPEYQVQRIKEHIFMEEHNIGGKSQRFSPDIEIADAWRRLESGNFHRQDIKLLNHEYFESKFLGIFRTDYGAAHNAALRSGRDWDPNIFITPSNTWR